MTFMVRPEFNAGVHEPATVSQNLPHLAVPAEVLAASVNARFRSRQKHVFAEKALSAMRHQFGGHMEQPMGGNLEPSKL